MDKWENIYKEEEQAIKQERNFYSGVGNDGGIKILDGLSMIFMVAGFVALALIYFTDITLIQATCLFIISHVIAPSDGDIFRQVVKGMAEDLGYMRLNLIVIRKYITNSKKT